MSKTKNNLTCSAYVHTVTGTLQLLKLWMMNRKMGQRTIIFFTAICSQSSSKIKLNYSFICQRSQMSIHKPVSESKTAELNQRQLGSATTRAV